MTTGTIHTPKQPQRSSMNEHN